MSLIPWLLILLLPLIPAFWLVYYLRRYYRLRSRGFWVAREGRDNILYEERVDGTTRRLLVQGEMMTPGPHLIYVPNEEDWLKQMPEWAHGRRFEIIENVQSALGTKNYEYYWSQSRTD